MTHKKKLLLSALLPFFYSNAIAIEPAELDFDGIVVIPEVSIGGTYDDNYLATDDPEGSKVINITPSVKIQIPGKNYQYEMSYILDHQKYLEDGAENLTSHFLDLSADYELDIRNRFALTGNVAKTEIAADAFTDGELNAFTEKKAGIGYTYGAIDATGNIELGVSKGSNRSDNGFNEDQDRDFTRLDAGFIYKYSDKTKLTLEINTAQYDYTTNDGLDGNNIAYFIGSRWDITSKTTGFARLGKEFKDFKDSERDKTDLSIWELSFNWSPKTYSTFTFLTKQRIEEGLYGADFTDSLTNFVRWNHDWSRGYKTFIALNNINEDFSTDRKDVSNSITAGLTYEAKRWLDLSINLQRSSRNSNIDTNDFNRNIINLNADISL